MAASTTTTALDYLRAHIEEMKKAVTYDGVDLMGYTRGAASTACHSLPGSTATLRLLSM